MLNIRNESYELHKTGHLPNSLQANKLEFNWTFQNNHGIFLVVSLDIQSVLYNFKGRELSVCFLQYHKEMMPLNLRRIEVGC